MPNFFNSREEILFNTFYSLPHEIIHLNKKNFNYRPNSSSFGSYIDFQEENPFDNFYKTINKSNAKYPNFNIPIISDSLKLQIDIFKELSYSFKNSKINLSNTQLFYLKKYCKEKPFIITQCDKNIGTAIISKEDYIKISDSHLNDINTYEEIFYNPLVEAQDNIKASLRNLFNRGDISKRLCLNLFEPDAKLGSFRILPKLHKSKFGSRQLINSIRHITSRISLFLNCLMMPSVVKIESYLKDSQSLLQKCEETFIPSTASLITADFESLYTNIDHIKAADAITDLMHDKLPLHNNKKQISPHGFHALILLVLMNNFFVFNNRYFKQIKGVAMGTIVGPSIANLYIYTLEKKWLNIHSPLLFSRYIDDLFIILFSRDKLQETITSLQNSFDNLKLNIEHGEEVVFLDLKIKINKIVNRLDFNLFIKPTNTFSYLLTNSNHPAHIFKNIPKSLFIRLRRNNSRLFNYFYHARKLIFNLLDREYSYKILNKTARMVSNLKRSDLLKYKDKTSSFGLVNNKTFIFKTQFDNSLPQTHKCIKNAYQKVSKESEKIFDTELKIINKIQPNLGSILINNFKLPIVRNFFCGPCCLNNCKLCRFINKDYKIIINDNCTIPIVNNSNCNAKFCIYFIFCKKCKKFYVGETKDLHQRMYKHLYDIKNFKPFISEDKCVPLHFRMNKHNYNDFSIFILQSNLVDDDVRFQTETFYINLIKRIDHKLLINTKIPNLYFKYKVF